MAEKVQLELDVKLDNALKSVDELSSKVDELGKTSKKTEQQVGKIGKGVSAIGTALKGAGIGLVIAALAKLSEAFNSNQKFVDGMSTAMTALSIIFGDFVNFIGDSVGPVADWFKKIFDNPLASLKSLGNAIKENIIERFKSALEVYGYLGRALVKLFKGDFSGAFESVKSAGVEMVDVLTGVDDSVGKITTVINTASVAISKYASEVIKTASSFTDLENQLKIMESQQQLIQLGYQKDAELQRQIRDDVSKTFAERKAANDALGLILESQLAEEQKLVDLRIRAAQMNAQMNGNNVESMVRVNEALAGQAELEERIAGQRSEQLTNINALILEQRGVTAELATYGRTAREQELIELELWYEKTKELARLNGQEDSDIMLEYLEKESNIKQAWRDEEEARNERASLSEIERMEAERQAKLSIASSAVAGLGSLATLSFKNAEKAEKFQKGIAIAQLAIDTARSISSAIAGAQAAALATGPAAPFTAPILIAGAIASTLGAFVQAKQILNQAKGPSAPSLSAPSIPSGPQDQSNAARGIDIDTENEGSGDSMITKTYVLSKDVSSKQELDAAIKRESVI